MASKAMISRIRSNRTVWYALAGAVLSIGAPTGLLVLREVYAPRAVTTELMSDRLTYLYVLLASAVVLAFIGFLLGRQADRLASLSQTDALTGLPNRRALSEHIREELHRAARYRRGGDEFGIVAPNTTSDGARVSAERLITQVRSQRDEHGRAPTVSIGIATFDPNRSEHGDVESLARAADRALYQAKADGRNRVAAA